MGDIIMKKRKLICKILKRITKKNKGIKYKKKPSDAKDMFNKLKFERQIIVNNNDEIQTISYTRDVERIVFDVAKQDVSINTDCNGMAIVNAMAQQMKELNWKEN